MSVGWEVVAVFDLEEDAVDEACESVDDDDDDDDADVDEITVDSVGWAGGLASEPLILSIISRALPCSS